MEVEYNVTNLPHQHVLPVARGLVALILHNSANVDMFLLACKVRNVFGNNNALRCMHLYRKVSQQCVITLLNYRARR